MSRLDWMAFSMCFLCNWGATSPISYWLKCGGLASNCDPPDLCLLSS
jgi:hypothetical protein